MKAFNVKTTESDFDILVIAEGYREAVERLKEDGIYDCDIISITALSYSGDLIKIVKDKPKCVLDGQPNGWTEKRD